MSLQPDLARKVRQLDNEVQSIYELLAGIAATQLRQSSRLEELGVTQDQHTATLAEHTATLAEHGAKLDRIIRLLEQH